VSELIGTVLDAERINLMSTIAVQLAVRCTMAAAAASASCLQGCQCYAWYFLCGGTCGTNLWCKLVAGCICFAPQASCCVFASLTAMLKLTNFVLDRNITGYCCVDDGRKRGSIKTHLTQQINPRVITARTRLCTRTLVRVAHHSCVAASSTPNCALPCGLDRVLAKTIIVPPQQQHVLSFSLSTILNLSHPRVQGDNMRSCALAIWQPGGRLVSKAGHKRLLVVT
jgi:hypothetical protein